MMWDRDYLDKYIPNPEVASEIILKHYKGGPPADASLEDLCVLLADIVRDDRFSAMRGKKDWTKQHYDGMGDWWEIHSISLEYKSSGQYLTDEGWPLGTECWFVRICEGANHCICAETPLLAAWRGLVYCMIYKKWRSFPPPERPRKSDMVML